MRISVLILLAITVLGFSSHPRWAIAVRAGRPTAVPQFFCALPSNGLFEGLSERPGKRIGLYWSRETPRRCPFVHVTNFDFGGRALASAELPGQHFIGSGIQEEDWNFVGQHVFLPQCEGGQTNPLFLKQGKRYRALLNLPRFCSPEDQGLGLQDVRLSPDGGCVYALSKARLWIVGAQTGRLIRIVKPATGSVFSTENAVLSADCRTILGMRGKMAVFSTRTGALLSRWGVKLETVCGGCGCSEARLLFSGDGKYAVASVQGPSDYETWTYRLSDSALAWHGNTPYELRQAPGGHFFFDDQSTDEQGGVTPVLRRWSDGKVAWHLYLNFPYPRQLMASPIVCTRDGRWIYFLRGRAIWRVPAHLPKAG